MSVYRQPPAQSAPKADDPEHVRKWFGYRDQFTPLGDQGLWPPAPTNPFDSTSVDALAISGDGRVAFVQASRKVWLVDTHSLELRPQKSAPDSTRVVALNDDGSRAVLVCGRSIYVWDLDRDSKATLMWQAEPLSNTKFISISSDGKTAAVAASSRTADVRIFDLERKTLVYSFKADSDEGMHLHPGGRHIICFGDDGIARIFGPDGCQSQLDRTAGGAFSRDGLRLLINDLDKSRHLRLYPVAVSGEHLQLGSEHSVSTGFKAACWNAVLRFSPSGAQALVEGEDDNAYVVGLPNPPPGFGEDLAAARYQLGGEMSLSSAIVADETRAFLGPSSHDYRYSSYSVEVVHWSDAVERLGAITASSREIRLVGTSPLGFFGALGGDPAPVGEKLVKYYERPGMMESILGGGEFSMERDDELHAREVAVRAEVWQPYLSELTADINHRHLMDLNKGIVHLTPAIAERARAMGSDSVRFGASQLSWDALNRAAEEIRAMSPVEQGRLFDEVLASLRRIPTAEDAAQLSEEQALERAQPQAMSVRRHALSLTALIVVPIVATTVAAVLAWFLL
jgi:WD40 repeat protein